MAENTVNAEKAPKKEKKSLDPRIAFALMVIMICCSLCIGANKAWKKNRGGVEASLEIWHENMQQRVETAYNLLTVAGRYLSEQDELMKAVRSDLRVMETADARGTMQASADAGSSFIAHAGQLLAKLSGDERVQQDKRDAMYVSSMLPQAVEQCGNNAALIAYNAAAESYNSGLRSFSGLLARLTGVSMAETVSLNASAEETSAAAE